MTQFECFSSCGVSVALFESGDAVVFVPESGEAVTCSVDSAYEWLDTGGGELRDMLDRLGVDWRGHRYTSVGVSINSEPRP